MCCSWWVCQCRRYIRMRARLRFSRLVVMHHVASKNKAAHRLLQLVAQSRASLDYPCAVARAIRAPSVSLVRRELHVHMRQGSMHVSGVGRPAEYACV